MSGSCRESLPVVREWAGDPTGCPVEAGWPSRMSESGLEALLDVRSFREALPDVWELSEGPPGSSGGTPGCPCGV